MDLANEVSKCVSSAVSQVFLTMLDLRVEHDTAQDDLTPPPFELNGVNGTVSFAGPFTGIVYFSVTPTLACAATQRILGGSATRPDEENDVIGELTNMITGNLKTGMADRGYNCQLSIPSIMRGEEIQISGKGFTVHLKQTFRVPELTENFVVRALVKIA